MIVKFLNLLRCHNVKVINLNYSSIKGPNGNIEYLIYFTKIIENDIKYQYESYSEDDVLILVNKAHKDLN